MLDKIEWIRRPAVSDDEVTKMLDIKLIRENPDKIKAGLKAKEVDCDELIDRILELDEQRRTLLQQTEALKAEQNKVSKQIPALVEPTQLKDGSIVVPEVLRKYLGGIEVITK